MYTRTVCTTLALAGLLIAAPGAQPQGNCPQLSSSSIRELLAFLQERARTADPSCVTSTAGNSGTTDVRRPFNVINDNPIGRGSTKTFWNLQ